MFSFDNDNNNHHHHHNGGELGQRNNTIMMHNDSDEEETIGFLSNETASYALDVDDNNKKVKGGNKKKLSKSTIILMGFMLVCSVVYYKKQQSQRNLVSFDEEIDNNNAEKNVFKEYHDLKIDDINHWCMDYTKTSQNECKHCHDPLQPKNRLSHESWKINHEQNKKDSLEAANSGKQIDVVFLGDSIVEGWKYSTHQSQFNFFFNSDESYYHGLLLGMNGDKTTNLLWRMNNGEIPTNLLPRVWWINIGTHDFTHNVDNYCSTDVVIMGIKRIIKEMVYIRDHVQDKVEPKSRHHTVPKSYIVIQNIIPRSDDEDFVNNHSLVDENDPNKYVLMSAILHVNDVIREYVQSTYTTSDRVLFHDQTYDFLKFKSTSLSKDISNMYISPALMKNDIPKHETHNIIPNRKGYTKLGQSIFILLHSLLDNDKWEDVDDSQFLYIADANAGSNGFQSG